MIKAYTDKNGEPALEVRGRCDDLIAEVCAIAATFYMELKMNDEELAQEFKQDLNELFAEVDKDFDGAN